MFCDVSKAFDRVLHKGFLFKLRQNGIEGKLLEWLNSYLSQRKQKVDLTLSLPSPSKTNTSVPSMFQGLLNIMAICFQHRVSPEPLNLLL